MALASRLKGLAKHAIELPPEPVMVAVFDHVKADRLITDLVATISAAYPAADCLPWLQAHRPDVWNELLSAENAVDRSFLSEDLPTLERAVDRLQRMYLKAFQIYSSRPPVIEVQESFL